MLAGAVRQSLEKVPERERARPITILIHTRRGLVWATPRQLVLVNQIVVFIWRRVSTDGLDAAGVASDRSHSRKTLFLVVIFCFVPKYTTTTVIRFLLKVRHIERSPAGLSPGQRHELRAGLQHRGRCRHGSGEACFFSFFFCFFDSCIFFKAPRSPPEQWGAGRDSRALWNELPSVAAVAWSGLYTWLGRAASRGVASLKRYPTVGI